jgi:NAD(P)-dependent dehydrogenase (short-subunit alcohol dehydrogenase family)
MPDHPELAGKVAMVPGATRALAEAVVAVTICDVLDEDGRTAAGRYGRPEEVGEAVVWLRSPPSSYVNGAVLPMDGGWTTG